jgi:hypothetical protein
MSAALKAEAYRSATASKLLSCTRLDGGAPQEGLQGAKEQRQKTQIY